MYIVELEKGVWLADWEGDPGRTVIRKNALQFFELDNAVKALKKAREYREFRRACIKQA